MVIEISCMYWVEMTPNEYERTFGVVVRKEYIFVKTH